MPRVRLFVLVPKPLERNAQSRAINWVQARGIRPGVNQEVDVSINFEARNEKATLNVGSPKSVETANYHD